MNKEQAVSYLRFSGFSDEQIKAIEEAFTCEDAINRAELLKAIDTWDKFGYTETGCFVREPKNDCVKYIHYDDVIECIKGMSPVNPQKPKSEWQQDHEILKAHSDGANEVLDIIKAEIESKYESISDTFHHYETGFTDALEWVLSIIDKYKEEGGDQE